MASCSTTKRAVLKKTVIKEVYNYHKTAFLGTPGNDLYLQNLDGSSQKIDTLRIVDFVTLEGEFVTCLVPMYFWRVVTDAEDGIAYEFIVKPLGQESFLRNINEKKLSVAQQMIFATIKDVEKWLVTGISKRGVLKENGTGGFDFYTVKKR
jgi:hypothetical protein